MKNTALKQWLKECLHFSRKERIAVLALISCIFLIKLLPQYFTPTLPAPQSVPDSLLAKLLQQQVQEPVYSPAGRSKTLPARTNNEMNKEGQRKGTGDHFMPPVFHFDPNSASREDWERLGLPPRLTSTILNYRRKGGEFRSADDLKRIYGMPVELAERLRPYVQLKKTTRSAVKRKTLRPPLLINSADSLDWMGLPGIGPALSSRILKYRQLLGGFVAVSQVAEVYGLKDSVYQTLLPHLQLDTTELRPIAVNRATQEELARHPYIRWKIAKAIVRYRTGNGRFRSLADLARIHFLDTSLLNKLAPYCEF